MSRDPEFGITVNRDCIDRESRHRDKDVEPVPASVREASQGWSMQTALFKSKFRSILRYSTLVGHTQSQAGHLKSFILKEHGWSY